MPTNSLEATCGSVYNSWTVAHKIKMYFSLDSLGDDASPHVGHAHCATMRPLYILPYESWTIAHKIKMSFPLDSLGDDTSPHIGRNNATMRSLFPTDLNGKMLKRTFKYFLPNCGHTLPGCHQWTCTSKFPDRPVIAPPWGCFTFCPITLEP